MRSIFLTVYTKLICTAYLTCTDAQIFETAIIINPTFNNYYGASGSISVPGVDPCASHPCGINANCEPFGLAAKCACPEFYTGDPVVSCTLDACSESKDFFRVPESGNQCIKILVRTSRNWTASKQACKDEGLQLAKPVDPLAMRKFLLEEKGDAGYFWIGAKGSASGVIWLDSSKLLNNNPAWYPNFPGGREHNPDWCVKLMTNKKALETYPDQPYYFQQCSIEDHTFAMCELPAACSEDKGFLKVPKSGNQCIKILDHHSRNWTDSKKACEDMGLQLVKPVDPNAMREFILERLDGKYFWIGAKGSASGITWLDSSKLLNSNPAWYPGFPDGREYNSDWCVKLMTTKKDLREHPTQPYYFEPCDIIQYHFAMCE